MADTFTKIETIIVGSGGQAGIEFTSIPQTYKDLLIKFSGRNVNNVYTFSISINGTTITDSRRLFGTGSGNASTDTFNGMYTNYSGSAAGTFGNADIYILNYSSNIYKAISVDAVAEDNYSSAYMNLGALLASTTSSVSSVGLIPESGNFAQYSIATLYGIKSA
jgi:hypothetical protein